MFSFQVLLYSYGRSEVSLSDTDFQVFTLYFTNVATYLHDIFVSSKNVTSYIIRNVNHIFLPRVIPSLLRGVSFTVGHIYAGSSD